MDINKTLAEELGVQLWQTQAAVELIDEGNTIPFIARYRKEKTGSLNDEELRKLYERLQYLRNLEEKKTQVISNIEEQGKMTEELRAQILKAATLVVVEDLYRPYRPKRRTRATIAREKGLEPLANIIRLQMTDKPLETEALAFLDEEKGVTSVADALGGAADILAEAIADEADFRIRIREMIMKEGILVSSARDETAKSVYENYYDYQEPLSRIAGHRILALNRGEKEKFLTVRVQAPEEKVLQYLKRKVITRENPVTAPALETAVEDSWKRLIEPAVEREIRGPLTEKAEDREILFFSKSTSRTLTSTISPTLTTSSGCFTKRLSLIWDT